MGQSTKEIRPKLDEQTRNNNNNNELGLLSVCGHIVKYARRQLISSLQPTLSVSSQFREVCLKRLTFSHYCGYLVTAIDQNHIMICTVLTVPNAHNFSPGWKPG